MQAYFAASDRKRRRQVRDESVHDWINCASQDGIYRSAHARIAQESGATRKNLFVGGLNVGVSSNHGRNFSVKEPAQRDFLASGLPVNDDKVQGVLLL